MAVVVQPASEQDPTGAGAVLAAAKARAPQLTLIWGDGRYRGPTVAAAATGQQVRVEVVPRPPESKVFIVLKKRWVVERTFAWFGRYRRLAGRDYEVNPRVSEAVIQACMCHMMLRRLTKSGNPKIDSKLP